MAAAGGPGIPGIGGMMGCAEPSPSAWADGLSTADKYEWLCNCYQMRCDDDYSWGGGYLHGPYDPEATARSLGDDFLAFCFLANRAGVIPASGWSWSSFFAVAPKHIVFAFEKSDAKERWGGENAFQAMMGGRSLRYTGEQIYKTRVDVPGQGEEHQELEEQLEEAGGGEKRKELQDLVGGSELWAKLLADLEGALARRYG